jgi:nicotinamidase-related amidase
MSTTALLVIDMQKVYFESPILHARQAKLVAACNQLIGYCQSRGDPVVIVRTEHEPDHSTWTLNMLDDQQGYLFKGDEQTNMLDDLQTSNLPVMTKTRDSAFFATDLVERLRILGVERLIIAGVSTHTCIAQTAADAYAANLRVVLAKDAIATHRPEFHDTTLELLWMEYRQPALSNKQITKELKT